MKTEDLRAELDAARTYKAEQMAAAEVSVEAAKAALQAAEERLEAWHTRIPADVLNNMREEAARKAQAIEEDAYSRAAESIHAAAWEEARKHGKGILAPEAASKSTSFGIIGAIAFGTYAALVLKALAGVHSELGLALAVAVGGIVGLFAGFAFFNAHFVVDESLERHGIKHLSAFRTVRQTYFKNSSR